MRLIRFSALLLLFLFSSTVAAQTPTVRALLFHSPTCPHCQFVIDEVLPPLQQQYGDQLEIAFVNTLEADGGELFQNALLQWQVTGNRRGVPMLIVDDIVMVGSAEIPDQLPSLISSRLETGGTAWPTLSGLDSYMERHGLSGAEESGKPSGIGLAVFVLLFLLTALSLAVWRLMMIRPQRDQLKQLQTPLVPLLGSFGLLVAGYLSWVEMTVNEAVCGPIGACNVVQASPYASLLGVPIAVWGLLSYTLILILWLMRRKTVAWMIVSLGFVAVLFSTYLTIVEIYVIEAVCLWCLASAVVSAILLLVLMFEAVQRPQQIRTRRYKKRRRHTV